MTQPGSCWKKLVKTVLRTRIVPLLLAAPSGIGVGNRLAHFEQSVLLFKKALADAGAPVRAGVKSNYTDSPTDAAGRPLKKPESFLGDLVFQRIEPETI